MVMRTNRARKSASVSLVVTFVLGLAVGFSLCYALLEGVDRDSERPEVPETLAESPEERPEEVPTRTEPAAADTAPAETTQQPPEPPEPSPPTAPLPVEQEEVPLTPAEKQALWPGRHLILTLEAGELEMDTADMIARRRPGGVLVATEDGAPPEIITATIQQAREAAGAGRGPTDLPLGFLTQEGGQVNPLNLPGISAPALLGAQGGTANAREAGAQQAIAARNVGVAVLLAPRLDLHLKTAPDPAPQYFGDTAGAVAAAGIAFARGVLEQGVVPVVKTYPGMSAATLKGAAFPVVGEEDVQKIAELMLPFAEAADLQLPALLAGNAAVPLLDKAQTRPACASPVMIREILREKWQYGGVVIADVRDTAHFAAPTLQEHVVDCLAAGCDAVLLGPVTPETVDALCEAIVAAIQVGKIPPPQYGQSRTRLETLRGLVGRMTPQPEDASPETPPAPEEPPQPVAIIEMIGEPAAPSAEDTPPPGGEAPPVPGETPPPQAPEPQPEPEPQPATAATPAPALQEVVHKVEKGDSLTAISRKYGVEMKAIQELNNLKDSTIKIGQELKIAVPAPEPEGTPEEANADIPAPPVEEAAAAPQPEAAPEEESAAPEEAAPAPEAQPEPAPTESTESVPPAADPAPAVPETPADDETAPPAETPEEAEAPAPPEAAEETPPQEKAPASPEEPTPAPPAPEAGEKDAAPPEEEVATPPAPEQESIPEAVPAPEPAAEPEPAPEPAVTPEPEPAPATETAPEPAPAPETPEPVREEDTAEESEATPTEPAPMPEPAPETAPAEPPTPQAEEGEHELYTVQAGDNVYRLAIKCGMTQEAFMKLNNIPAPNALKLGAKVKMPKKPE